jgi:metallo-beta-lactamase family protein
MRITVCGAAGEVTGSAYLVETDRARVLLDCGMFQGLGASDEKNRDLGPIDPARLTSVVITHAHLDHTGRLPLLTQKGFHGNLFCTPATEDFTRLILLDSAHIQESDAERYNRKLSPGHKPDVPLYTKNDVDHLNPLIRTVKLDSGQEVAPGISVKFREAGHILGSAAVEMTVSDAGKTRTIAFSGDLGPLNSPILNDYVPVQKADLVFQETTYGNREHRPLAETVIEFRGILREAVARNMKILIPAFAIGRSQQVIYHIAEAVRDKVISPIPIYLDSPMAIEATRMYGKHRELFDAEAAAHEKSQDLAATLDRLTFTQSADESKALNGKTGPMVIIAGSGMCDAGRIVHHLQNNLDNPNTAVVIVGYQGQGSLGQRLVSGAKEVKIYGNRVPVRATVHTLGGFSGHAGQNDLLTWAKPLAATKPRWILTHGEDDARTAYQKQMQDRYGITAECPKRYDVVEMK